MADTDTGTLRPFSSSSIISPHAALEAISQDQGGSSRSPSSYPGDQAASKQEGEEIMDDAEDRRPPSRAGTGGNGVGTGGRGNEVPRQYMVRAQFDFEASDPSALSFRAGDLIEVYTMLESGWWDGMLGDQRGWFPSNFVEEVDYEGSVSEDPHGSSLDHHGLVGDELDRERDKRMLEREDFGPPLRGPSHRGDFGMEDALAGGAGWGPGGGLEDLAKEMMDANLQDAAAEGQSEDDGKAFEAEASRRRMMSEADDATEFGTMVTPPSRRREETDDTIKAGANGQRRYGSFGPNGTPMRGSGESHDAWIPSLTPDGQVYYLNTHTGDTSWEMPVSTPSAEEDEYYYSNRQSGEGYFDAYPSAPSSSAHLDRGVAPPAAVRANTEESFRLPPYVQGEIPYPWVSRMSDDGREWLYYNRITGQTRSDLPPPGGTGADAISSFEAARARSRHSSRASSLPIRASVELQRKAVEDWEKRTRQALDNVLKQAAQPSLVLLLDHVQDTLREVFEACVAGSAAEEEMSRASDLGSESGMATAALREESARDMLAESHTATLASVRDLLGSFGYAGPLDKMEELPRPSWTKDVTLVGSIGLLSSNVHAAVVSRVKPASGSSTWTEVLRAATRLKDVVTDLPARMRIPEDQPGDYLSGYLGISSFDVLGGRWGFSSEVEDLRPLDNAAVIEAQRLKADFESALPSGDILHIAQQAHRFSQILSIIDIASMIDVDGEAGEGRARQEEVEAYSELVARARQDLFDLDHAYRLIATASAGLLHHPDPTPVQAAVDTSFRCLSTLLMVVKEQQTILAQSALRGSVGHRSAAYRARRRQRHHSTASQTSATSRLSRSSRVIEVEELRRKAKTMEQEYEEEEQALEQLRDGSSGKQTVSRSATAPLVSSSSANVSASASQTSLRFGSSGHRAQRSMSATSSSTSLAYKDTESDSGSQKGNNRSSFMRFMKGRTSEDDGGSRRNKPSKKLAKILGEDSFAQIPINKLPSQPAPLVSTPIPERPWYLGDDFDTAELVFDDRGAVKAGTLRALVARLTPHGSTDTAFFQAFLLTFRSFTSGDDLLDLLMERYNIQPPPQLEPGEMVEWKKQKQTPIKLRPVPPCEWVVNTIRSWLDVHYFEAQDAPILDRVDKFADDLKTEGSSTMATQLQNLVARRRSAEADGPRRVVSGNLLSPPAPLTPRIPAGRTIRLLDISPVELARQLTIIESLHFQRIKAIECLNKAWAREDGPKAAPNVRWVILTANRMAGWVALQILSSKDVKVRASIMKYFVQTAIELRNLNNFSSMAGVVAGLNSAPITRLKRTKELLSAKTVSLKANLDATLDSSKNFANYKDMLKTINPPCVPFFGFYLSALTFIEDGNKDLVQPGGHTQPLINFFKRSLSAEILRDIQQYQSQPYNLARCKPVYDYICSGLEVVEKSGDLYEMSLILEPRERDEERVTRMLQENGFL